MLRVGNQFLQPSFLGVQPKSSEMVYNLKVYNLKVPDGLSSNSVVARDFVIDLEK